MGIQLLWMEYLWDKPSRRPHRGLNPYGNLVIPPSLGIHDWCRGENPLLFTKHTHKQKKITIISDVILYMAKSFEKMIDSHW